MEEKILVLGYGDKKEIIGDCLYDCVDTVQVFKAVDKWFFYLYLIFQQRALLKGIGDGATKNLNKMYVDQQEIVVFKLDQLLKVFSQQELFSLK